MIQENKTSTQQNKKDNRACVTSYKVYTYIYTAVYCSTLTDRQFSRREIADRRALPSSRSCCYAPVWRATRSSSQLPLISGLHDTGTTERLLGCSHGSSNPRCHSWTSPRHPCHDGDLDIVGCTECSQVRRGSARLQRCPSSPRLVSWSTWRRHSTGSPRHHQGNEASTSAIIQRSRC